MIGFGMNQFGKLILFQADKRQRKKKKERKPCKRLELEIRIQHCHLEDVFRNSISLAPH